jgi:hypothetical protein
MRLLHVGDLAHDDGAVADVVDQPPVFFNAVGVEALKIGSSPVAPWFNVVAKPNIFTLATRLTAGGSRYAGSWAETADKILIDGGAWREMAEKAGVTQGRLRAHARYRTEIQKKYRLEENGDQAKLVRIEADAIPTGAGPLAGQPMELSPPSPDLRA